MDCKEGTKLDGRNYALCENNTMWSPQPVCERITCPTPILSNGMLEFKEICSLKFSGEFCGLKCKRGKLIGSEKIECLTDTSWTSLPICGCSSPILNEGLEARGNCDSKRPRDQCNLFCKRKFRLIGLNNITCRSNTQWTELPRCEKIYCSEPSIPKDVLEFVRSCSSKSVDESCRLKCKKGGTMIGSATITCLNDAKWSEFPSCHCPPLVLSAGLETGENCAEKKIKETCRLRCKENFKLMGRNQVICQIDSSWSPLPKCERIKCSEPLQEYRGIVELAEDCSSKTVGETCSLKCKQGGVTLGKDFVKCMNANKWSEFSGCTCPPPVLTVALQLDSKEQLHCDSISPQQKCWLECQEDFTISGANYITCQTDTTWSTLPTCTAVTFFCTEPELPEIYEILGECSSIEINDSCRVRCANGSKMVDNSLIHRIKCYGKGQWTKPPNCTCPTPVLTGELQLNKTMNTNCDRLIEGSFCFLECEKDYRLVGLNYINCHLLSWKGLPECVYEGNMSGHCFTPTRFSEFFFVPEPCFREAGQSCALMCKNGGLTEAGTTHVFVTCKGRNRWSEPKYPCACVKPKLGLGLFTKQEFGFPETCDRKVANKKCFLYCDIDYILEGLDYIYCRENLTWSPQPVCKYRGGIRTACQKPELSGMHEALEMYSTKLTDQIFPIKCKNGGTLLDNSSFTYIKCLGDNKWSKPVGCHCPPPELARVLKGGLKIDRSKNRHCDAVAPRMACFLLCKSGFELRGSNYITCQENGSWTAPPICEYNGDTREYCLEPPLPAPLVFISDCSLVPVHGTCYFKCKEGTKLFGAVPSPFAFSVHATKYPTMQCKAANQWSEMIDYYGCSCPTPALSRGVEIRVGGNRDCDFVAPNRVCHVACLKYDFEDAIPNNLLCKPDGEWSLAPACLLMSSERGECFRPRLPSRLDLEGECKITKVFQSCPLKCKNGGKMLGVGRNFKKITCMRFDTWDKIHDKNFPICSCASPVLPTGMQFNTQRNSHCDTVTPGQMCFLSCKSGLSLRGEDHIVCQSDTTWTYLPLCVSDFSRVRCPIPELLEYQKFREDCSNKKVGQTCSLSCVTRASFTPEDMVITCLQNGMWSKLSKCFCSFPTLVKTVPAPGKNSFSDDCLHTFSGIECWLRCIPGHILRGPDFITCNTESEVQWEPEPYCQPNADVCPFPPLPENMKFIGKCEYKIVKEVCFLGCKYGKMIGEEYIECLEGAWWSPLPQCACPPPTGIGHPLQIDTSIQLTCDEVVEGKACWLKCAESFHLIGANYISCYDGYDWSRLPTCKFDYDDE